MSDNCEEWPLQVLVVSWFPLTIFKVLTKLYTFTTWKLPSTSTVWPAGRWAAQLGLRALLRSTSVVFHFAHPVLGIELRPSGHRPTSVTTALFPLAPVSLLPSCPVFGILWLRWKYQHYSPSFLFYLRRPVQLLWSPVVKMLKDLSVKITVLNCSSMWFIQ